MLSSQIYLTVLDGFGFPLTAFPQFIGKVGYFSANLFQLICYFVNHVLFFVVFSYASFIAFARFLES